MLDVSSAQGPFSHYTSDEPIVSAGVRVQEYSGDVDTLFGDVNGSHAPAVAGVAGLLDQPMIEARTPLRDRTRRWAASAVFAGGAVVVFGGNVLTFNTAVDDLNRRYRSARGDDFGVTAPDLPADATAAHTLLADAEHRAAVASAGNRVLLQLQAEHDTVLLPALDDAAADVATLLARGPDDEAAVLRLYAAGALPLASPVLFPGVNFASVPPPLNGGQGRHAAEVIERALDGEATPAEFREAMAMLQLVTDHARYVSEHGGTLTEDSVAFLHQFYNTLDERILDIPTYVADDDITWSNDRQDLMLAAMGTGILALLNPALWHPSISNQDPMDRDSRYHLPPRLIDLVSDRVAWRAGGMMDAIDLADFRALGAMLGETDDAVTGGRDFSAQLTVRVAELAAGTFTFGSADPFDVEPLMRQLLDVSTRNPEGNHAVLTGEFERREADDGHLYPFDLARNSVLQYLYDFEWSDDGRTVTGLTDWIPGYSLSDDPGRRDLAGESAAALIRAVTSTEAGGYPDGRYNLWDHLMDTTYERNPEILAGFGRVATSYLDGFAAESPPNAAVRTEWDGALSVNQFDRSYFMSLLATDDATINRLSIAAGAYKENMLQSALAAGDPNAIQDAAAEAGNLDGLLAAARVNASTVSGAQEYQDANAAWAEHMRFADLGKGAFTTAVGLGIATPTANPTLVAWTNFGIGQLADQFVTEVLPAPDAPGHPRQSPVEYIGADLNMSTHDYVNTLIDSGHLSMSEVADFERAVQVTTGNPDMTIIKPVAGTHGYPVAVLKSVDELTSPEWDALQELVRRNGGDVSGHPYTDHYGATEAYTSAARETSEEVESYRRGQDRPR